MTSSAVTAAPRSIILATLFSSVAPSGEYRVRVTPAGTLNLDCFLLFSVGRRVGSNEPWPLITFRLVLPSPVVSSLVELPLLRFGVKPLGSTRLVGSLLT